MSAIDLNKTFLERFRVLFFVGQMPLGIFNPFLIVYLNRTVGLTGSELGIMFAIGALILVLTQQVWGYLGDVILSRRTLSIVTVTMSALLFYLFRYAHTFTSVAILYGVYSLFNSAVIQLQNGFFLSYRGSDIRYARVRAFASVGYAVANMGVALLCDYVTGHDYTIIFPLYFITSVATVVATLALPDPQPPAGIFTCRRGKLRLRPAAQKRERVTFLHIQNFFLSRPEVVFFLLVVFIYQLGHSLSFYLLPLVLTSFGANSTSIGLNTALGAILEVPVFFIALPLIRRFGEARLVAVAGLVQTIRWLLVWNADTSSDVILASTLHSVTFGLFYASSVSYMNRKAGEHFKASAQTLYALVVSGLGVMFGNYLCAQIAPGGPYAEPLNGAIARLAPCLDHGPLLNLYLICACTALLSTILALLLWRFDKTTD